MYVDRRILERARSQRAALALTVGLGVLAGAIVVLQAHLLSRVIAGGFLEGLTLAEAQPLLLLLLGLAVARASCNWAGEVSAQRVAGRVKVELRDALVERLLALGPGYTRRERTGELTGTLVDGVEALDAYLGQYLPQLAQAALVPLLVLAFVLPRDPLSGLVLLVTAPLIPIFMVLIGGMARERTRRQWTALSRLSGHFLDVLQGLTTLRLLGRSRQQGRVIADVTDRFRRATLNVLKVAFLSALVLELAATLGTAVVAVQVGLRLLYGRLSFEESLFVLILAPELYRPLRGLGAAFHAAMPGAEAAQRIFAVLETPPPTSAAAPGSPRVEPPPGPFGVKLDAVSFCYAPGRSALAGVSFAIAAGQTLALVGPSGAGKTTVAHLLLRFAEPQAGHIEVGGTALADLDPTAWRQHVAWVPQLPHLFDGTVADNIRLARPQAGQREVVEAARLAHAEDFIESLPRGYDSLLGERGARLSGGQAQRLALARAFLKDAPFVILDEATSQLDPEHESLIHESMQRLRSGRTVLLIAHRLGTVFDADQIVLLSGGRVVEQGSHAALLGRGRVYPRLVAAYEGAP